MIRRVLLPFTVLLFLAGSALGDWRSVAPGVDYQEFAESGMDVHVTRVDLSNEAVRVISSRQADRGLKVSDYAKKNKALVAMNGDYFDDKFYPVGLTIGPCGQWEGTKDTSREGFLAIGDDNGTIYTQSDVIDPVGDGVDTAVSGWPLLVKECAPLPKLPGSDAFTRSAHPRTAVGLSSDRKTLYLVVADGRRAGIPGLTLPQLASFMADRLHACSAINLDGGGSSAMWVGDKIVNRPSDGVERRVAVHLAVVLARDVPACEAGAMTSAAATGSRRIDPRADAAAIVTTTTTTTTTTTVKTTTTTPAASTDTAGKGSDTTRPIDPNAKGADSNAPKPVLPPPPPPSRNGRR
ncbi:MAG: hypothetical protein JWN02_1809 [Acidobacteria bacterium]|nr:hypothetical protein [Acidobacteriota bacterium]